MRSHPGENPARPLRPRSSKPWERPPLISPRSFGHAKKKKSVLNHMTRIREAIQNQVILLCGSRKGVDYLLGSDIVTFDADLNLKALIKAEKLPTVNPKPWYTKVGFPVVERRGKQQIRRKLL